MGHCVWRIVYPDNIKWVGELLGIFIVQSAPVSVIIKRENSDFNVAIMRIRISSAGGFHTGKA